MKNSIKLSIITLIAINQLSAQEITLDTITVTSATKSEQLLNNITSNVNVITSEELEEKHYTTVTEALNSIPGINYTSNGGLGSTTSINLRGAGNNRTLVLIDGVRYQDPSSTSGASIGHLLVQDIERIEVIKGAQSGVWGGDASAGVINIITKRATKEFSALLNFEIGSFNTKKFGTTISHKTSDFDIKLSANKTTSNGFSVQAPRSEGIDNYEDDAYSNTTLNLKANYSVTNTSTISLNITDIDALKEYDSFGNPNDTTLKSDVSNRIYNLSYLQTYNNHNFTLKVEKSEFSRDEIGTVAQFGSEYVKEFMGEHRNIELMDNIKYYQDSNLILGLGSSSDEVDYILTDNSAKYQKNKNSYIYLTNSSIFDKLILSQSIRHDNYNNFDSKTTAKIGVKYNLNKEMFITSNIGTAYNVPNIVQELNPWGALNSDLNPEDTVSTDISFGYKNFKITYFRNEVTDLIEWYDPDGWGGNPAIYKNLDGESIFKGFEFEYFQNITNNIFISLNGTILSAKDKDGENLARRAKETLKLTLDYYPIDKLHIGIFGEYLGERFDKKNDKGVQTGKYTVANLVTNYDINQNFSIYLKVDNIFDTYYQTSNGYTTAPLSGYIGISANF